MTIPGVTLFLRPLGGKKNECEPQSPNTLLLLQPGRILLKWLSFPGGGWGGEEHRFCMQSRKWRGLGWPAIKGPEEREKERKGRCGQASQEEKEEAWQKPPADQPGGEPGEAEMMGGPGFEALSSVQHVQGLSAGGHWGVGTGLDPQPRQLLHRPERDPPARGGTPGVTAQQPRNPARPRMGRVGGSPPAPRRAHRAPGPLRPRTARGALGAAAGRACAVAPARRGLGGSFPGRLEGLLPSGRGLSGGTLARGR